MPYRRKQRKFSRERNTRNALKKSLAEGLIVHEKIHTTAARAKTIRPVVERMVTYAKTPNLAATRLLAKRLAPATVKKLVSEIAPRYKERSGGYTRITHTARRRADGAPMAIIEFV
ncbi:MAG: 50S ribosomal protein L17 [bacterium]|nr:50S ribosomal protein L17 [bacterium]MDZ4295987.1 50S ribosomal protein L17 [Patescibacteria group bacterium]